MDPPDVGDVLESPERWYLIVDAEQKRKYLHCLVDVYPKRDCVFPQTDGTWWELRPSGGR